MSYKKIYRVQRQQNVLWLRAAVGRNEDTPLLVRLLSLSPPELESDPAHVKRAPECAVGFMGQF